LLIVKMRPDNPQIHVVAVYRPGKPASNRGGGGVASDRISTSVGAPPDSPPPPRPWALYAVAIMLAEAAAVVVWAPVRHGDPVGAASVVVAALVGLLGVGPLLLRRVGWWCATVCLALLLAVQVGAATSRTSTGIVVGGGYELVALALLQSPGVHRYRRWRAGGDDAPVDSVPGPAPEDASVARPAGWTRELLGGWAKLVGMGVFALLCLVVGLAMLAAALGESGASVAGGLGVTLLGVTMAASVPPFWPRRRVRPRLGIVDLPGGPGPALLFPYSRLRSVAALIGCLGFTAFGIVLAIAPDPSGTRDTATLLRGLGVVCALVFGAAGVLALRRGGRRALLFASPELVGTHNAAAGGVVPWSAVRAIYADETTTYVRGVPIHEPHISAEARGELADRRGADRVRSRRLTG
jgi:hypothetical protein